MSNRLDPTFVRAQIDALRAAYPQIADDEDQWLLSLESETDLREFLTVAVKRICEAEAFVEGIDDLITDIKTRRQRFEQRGEAMRTMAFKLMSAADVRKLELPQATLSIRAGQPRVIITDEARLPPECLRIRTEPDKVRIKDRLSHGEHVDGAEMSNAESVLSVRIK